MTIELNIREVEKKNKTWWDSLSYDARVEFFKQNGISDKYWCNIRWSNLPLSIILVINKSNA